MQVRAFTTWVAHTADKRRQAEVLQRVAHLLTRGTATRTFCAWRDHVMDTVLKRVAFVRKQRALKSATLLGNQLLRRKRHQLLIVCFEVRVPTHALVWDWLVYLVACSREIAAYRVF